MFETNKIIKVLNTTFLTLAFVNAALGCVYFDTYISNIDEKSDYIFIGNIVGYTENRSRETSSIETGLEVEVTETINLPQETPNYYEVFLNDICGTSDVTKKWLKKKFPINSKVRLFANKTDRHKSVDDSKEIRLSALFWEITRNDNRKLYKSTVNSIFDYSKWKKNDFFIDFELRKDLFRLINTDDLDEKVKILERLAFNRNRLFDYQTAVENEIINVKLRKKLYKIRKKARLPLLPLLIDPSF